jgi:hypothetical protein
MKVLREAERPHQLDEVPPPHLDPVRVGLADVGDRVASVPHRYLPSTPLVFLFTAAMVARGATIRPSRSGYVTHQ